MELVTWVGQPSEEHIHTEFERVNYKTGVRKQSLRHVKKGPYLLSSKSSQIETLTLRIHVTNLSWIPWALCVRYHVQMHKKKNSQDLVSMGYGDP